MQQTALSCTSSVSEILHWPPAVIPREWSILILLEFCFLLITSLISTSAKARPNHFVYIHMLIPFCHMSYWAFWHKSHLILLVITLPSLAVICSLLEILFRKCSRNFNAGHKSAARCWIIEERPIKQTFGACPAREQRLYYMFPSTKCCWNNEL